MAEYDKFLFFNFSKSQIRKLETFEKCLIYRRRCNKKQEEIAKELGICRYTLRKMENGIIPCGTLLGYWEC